MIGFRGDNLGMRELREVGLVEEGSEKEKVELPKARR